MNRLSRLLAIGMLAAGVTGCATGPKFTEVKSSIPTLNPDSGRIYFYRPTNMGIGSGIRPDVQLNGKVVGQSKAGGFFFVDAAPGDYEVMLSTEVDKKLTFILDKGQERCVRMAVGLGVIVYRVYPELADKPQCDSEIAELSYIGTELKR
jgi:hypothetical protein